VQRGVVLARARGSEPREADVRSSATPQEDKGNARGEIRFAPDMRLNVAYNPNCTDEAAARESLIQEVTERSERGERSACPRCDQIMLRYLPIRTALGLFGVGACEKCGYWFLM
jgi:hypothetical protein